MKRWAVVLTIIAIIACRKDGEQILSIDEAVNNAVEINFTDSCEYSEPKKVYVQVRNWVDVDSIKYAWLNTDTTTIGRPVEVRTFMPDSSLLNIKYFWSDEVEIIKIQEGGFWFYGLHWFAPAPEILQGHLVSIRFYRDESLSDEIISLRSYFVPQWESPNGLTSFEGYKGFELCE